MLSSKLNGWLDKKPLWVKLSFLATGVCLWLGWFVYLLIFQLKNPEKVKQGLERIGYFNPVSWIDVFLGFFIGVMLVVIIFMFESFRFSRQVERNTSGPDGGGGKVRLPMSRKVISIAEFKKLNPDKVKWKMSDDRISA